MLTFFIAAWVFVTNSLTHVSFAVTLGFRTSPLSDAAWEAVPSCAGECGARGRACNPRDEPLFLLRFLSRCCLCVAATLL